MNWDQLTPKEFEELIYTLVTLKRYRNVERVGGTGDEGVDVVAYMADEDDADIDLFERKVIFQCKLQRKFSKRSIVDELANFAGGGLDTWVLVTIMEPTAQFRRWFEGLEKNSDFYIKAWWLDEIQTFIRSNINEMTRYCPNLIEKLTGKDLGGLANDQDVFQSVVARFRGQVNSQIDHFARGKYIPKLYVPREFQDKLWGFAGPEKHIASAARKEALDIIDQVSKQFERKIGEFKAKIDDPKARASGGRTKKQREKSRNDMRFHKTAWQESKTWRRDFPKDIQSLISSIKEMPADRYFDARHYVKTALLAVSTLEKSLAAMPRTRIYKENEDVELLVGHISVIEDSHFAQLKGSISKASRILESLLMPAAQIIDRAGCGKTNLVCHLAEDMAINNPVMLLFGKEAYANSDALVDRVKVMILNNRIAGAGNDPIEDFDEILRVNGSHLTVFIDGINENRRISDFNEAILVFLQWAANHRMKIILTCRDIYWEFFTFGTRSDLLKTIGSLDEFSSLEYKKALPLYLAHYNIKCELVDKAREACQHPLLLRFFCEAYGDVDGELTNLGLIMDIRLRELFEKYFLKKTDQISKSLGHLNTQMILRYLYNLVGYMMQNASPVILTNEIESATGNHDTSTQDSFFVHLLDEDIIIEEQPSDTPESRLVSFVYEEFMEYLIARALLSPETPYGVQDIEELFGRLNTMSERLVNARGVGEYVAQMLLSEDFGHSQNDGLLFLKLMARGGSVWQQAFWSAISKCREEKLCPAVFDEFHFALSALGKPAAVKDALATMSRLSTGGCDKLAVAILWSGTLPQVITWSDFEELKVASNVRVQEIANSLADRRATDRLLEVPGKMDFKSFLAAVLPFVNPEAKTSIEHAIFVHGWPGERKFGVSRMVQVIWGAFPEHRLLLLNGLFCEDAHTRGVCAERIKLANEFLPQIMCIAQALSAVEGDRTVKALLDYSISALGAKIVKQTDLN